MTQVAILKALFWATTFTWPLMLAIGLVGPYLLGRHYGRKSLLPAFLLAPWPPVALQYWITYLLPLQSQDETHEYRFVDAWAHSPSFFIVLLWAFALMGCGLWFWGTQNRDIQEEAEHPRAREFEQSRGARIAMSVVIFLVVAAGLWGSFWFINGLREFAPFH